MTKKRRVKLTLEESEAAVVAPVEFWNHLRTIYDAYANVSSSDAERMEWEWAGDLVRYWVEETRAQDTDDD